MKRTEKKTEETREPMTTNGATAVGGTTGTAATSGAATGEETTAELDAGDIQKGWEALQTKVGRVAPRHVTVAWGARSDIGRARENNEDKFDFYLPDDAATLASHGRLWAVADGMGGHNAGQVASEAALKTIIRTYFAAPRGNDVATNLRAAIADANALIARAAAQFPERGGMGTTAVAAVIRNATLTIGHVGDSRAYLLRGDEKEVRQLTDDHSWVEEQVRRGGLTRAEAEGSPYRNVITRSIGMEGTLEVDIVREALRPGDVLLLCSDGLSGYLDGPALRPYLIAARVNPSQAALSLIDAANAAGGRDNITALLLVVRSVEEGN